MFWINGLFENGTPPNKTIFQRMCNETFQSVYNFKYRMRKLIKLNYFEQSNTFESCKQPGIDIRPSKSIPEMVSILEIKIQVFFCKYISKV